MAKIGNEVHIGIGEDGLVVLRRPTNKEWNEFEAERYPVKRNKIMDRGLQARVNLFDKVLQKVENLEDDQGAITVETKERIPNSMKASAIFQAFEANEGIEVKN